jgi:hypothetical protein
MTTPLLKNKPPPYTAALYGACCYSLSRLGNSVQNIFKCASLLASTLFMDINIL